MAESASLSRTESLAVSRTVGLPVITARNVDYSYGSGETRTPVLHKVELDIGRGEIVIMTGPSGSGKTTLLTLIGALRAMQGGLLRVLNRDMSVLDTSGQVELRREIGFIFQLHNLFTSLSAIENVRMAAILKPQPDIDARAAALLNELGLGERLHSLPARLSGGQRQRVAIARALVNRPKLVLADEPTASLDATSSEAVVGLLRRLADGPERTTILLVTHDQRLIDRADRIVKMVDGRIVSNVLAGRVVRIVRTLKQIKELEGLSEATLARIAERMTVELFPAGTTIVTEGAAADRRYLIGSGSALAYKGGQLHREINAGESFGRITFTAGLLNTETVVSVTDLELYVLTREDLDHVMATDKSFEQRVREIVMATQHTQ